MLITIPPRPVFDFLSMNFWANNVPRITPFCNSSFVEIGMRNFNSTLMQFSPGSHPLPAPRTCHSLSLRCSPRYRCYQTRKGSPRKPLQVEFVIRRDKICSGIATLPSNSVPSVTSQWQNKRESAPNRLLSSSVVNSPASESRSQMDTFAPAESNCSAMARPRPVAAPVTRATLPDKLIFTTRVNPSLTQDSVINCRPVIK